MTWLKGHWQLFAIICVVFALWPTPVTLPLKLLVVLFHELSHAAVTVLTGGQVVDLSVTSNQGGHVLSRGGSRFWTLTSGYLGSLLIGLALLVGAVRTDLDRVMMGLCGLILLIVTALYIRDSFAVMFCSVTGLLMGLAAWKLPHSVNDMALRVFGLTSMIYVPFDILSDTILRSELRSDARMLAEEFGGPTIFWGGLWIVISCVAIYFALKATLRAPSNLSWGPR